ncbi:hypothetical protein C9374_014078 [Naegleria lovaniensis]|uniref:Uncharacterized protein n=1 Tax=Naegleria lovaniensis TaxID=51637 RepID=A0AA88H1Z3_NAELO|nr:uncharacterized protein C9374_014078 [Naegleria lovaniensis]KAG2389518.1 hypothetical protein C9374_014078 [Naegleria lovaniensis]
MYHSVRNIQDETKFNFTRNFIKLGYKIVDLEFSYLTTMEMKDWSDLFQSLSKQHSELTRLTIANCKISDSCLYDIFSEKNVNTFQQLKYLDLQGNLISQSAAFTISQPFVTQLNYLNISMNVNIGDEGIHEFVKSGVLNNLQSFILQRTQCTAQGVKSVTLLNQLTHLDLSKNSIQAEGISNLVQNITLCQNLKVLKLCHCGLRVAGMNTLISAEVHFKNLRHLDLEWNRLEEEGIQTLCSSSLLKQVTYLNLKLNGVNDRAAQCIAHSPHLQQLTALNLAQNHISHVGALALLTSTTLRPTLRMLNLNLNNVHDEHLKKTLQQEPNYEILKTGLNLLE